MSNYMKAVMDAVAKCTAIGSDQQLTDAVTTQVNIKLEQSVYNTWLKNISDAGKKVTDWAKHIADSSWKKYGVKSKQAAQDKLTAAQAEFQNTQTKQQTYTQQADSATQAMQNQTGQDAATLQQKIQLAAAINQINQSLASSLAQAY